MLRFRLLAISCLLAMSVTGCASRDTKAANAAAEAEAELQQGRNTAALRSIQQALKSRDDISEYWILLGKIATASGDFSGAFAAYENALSLDRSNVEVLRSLCQLGLTVRAPDKIDKYADQLLLLAPGESMPVVMKGSAALQRGDEAKALQFAEQVLAKSPLDSGAQILKARVLAARGNFAESAAFIEGTLGTGNDDAPKLNYLSELYARAEDRPRYQLTQKRRAEANPHDPTIQLEYADMLYQTGQNALANATIHNVAHLHPDNIGVAASILDTWLKQGSDAVALSQIRAQATAASLEIKAVYAQFASEIGHPEVALAILGQDLDDSPVTADNADAKSARAYAIALQGHRADALARLSEILEFDDTQPRALLARARVRAADRDFDAAIADARAAASQDPKNATARLALVDILFAHGDGDLGESALREAVRAMPEDVRLASRLAQFLLKRGQRDRAVEVLRDLTRANPVSLRAIRLRQSLDPSAVQESAQLKK